MKENRTSILTQEKEERLFQGAPVSEGIAIGKAVFVGSFEENEDDPERSISQEEIEKEIDRYRKAISSSRRDLQKLHQKLSKEGSTEAKHIIDSHIQMLSDPLMTTHVEEMIRDMKQNTEAVFSSVVSDYKDKLDQAEEKLFQERVIDVIDLSERVLGHLRPKAINRLSNIPKDAVIFANELAPSETAAVQASRVSAFVTQKGGGSSHAALIARSKGIPFVASIDIQLLKRALCTHVIVNGLTGDVIVNPSEKTLEKYRAIQKMLESQGKEIEDEVHFPSVTLDGHAINLYANVGSVLETEGIAQYGAQGVGLFRSEFLLTDGSDFFLSEEKQFEIYWQAILKMEGKPFVMRVFDVGGDKFPEIVAEWDKNTGTLNESRGIRFLLCQKKLFMVQLKALLRASAFGEVRLLLPLISDREEIVQTRCLIEEVRADLKANGLEVQSPAVGALIEIPAAAECCDKIAKESDFISIGTNDLTQFMLGIDRSQLEMNECRYSAHPSVIWMIKKVVESSHKYNKRVTLCGEIATNPHFVPLLIGLGIDALSCAPRYIPVVKRIVRKSKYKKCLSLSKKVLKCGTSEAVSQTLKKHYDKLR